MFAAKARDDTTSRALLKVRVVIEKSVKALFHGGNFAIQQSEIDPTSSSPQEARGGNLVVNSIRPMAGRWLLRATKIGNDVAIQDPSLRRN